MGRRLLVWRRDAEGMPGRCASMQNSIECMHAGCKATEGSTCRAQGVGGGLSGCGSNRVRSTSVAGGATWATAIAASGRKHHEMI